MLVYGDHAEVADPREKLDDIRQSLAELGEQGGLERHSKVVGALVEAGRLAQGLADAGSADAEAVALFLYRLAQCVVRSCDSRFADIGELPEVPEIDVAKAVELKLPEGFVFYAVYPEAYAAAARRLRLAAPPRVIGIRSIGTTLGAVVAVALGTPPPVTVRPFGDPFAREVELPPSVLEGDAHYVIVDEGPGQSGSSFGAVADWLQQRGVPLDRIAFLPSHAGEPGPQTSEAHRRRWREAQRVPAEIDLWWLEKLFGSLEQLSTGERLKFRAEANGERLLIKFVGLGEIGERKLAMARALHAAGFTPEPIGFVHGFLVERWCEGRALDADEKPVEEIGRYVGARARLFPAQAESGAPIEELLTMCRRNLSLGLQMELPRRWEPDALSRPVERVRTDNKLDRQEWLRAPDGRLIKLDALDHHQGHDLIGCQDIAWDLAGAIIEFDLGTDETERLIGAARPYIDRQLLEFYRVAYCCFRLGQASLAGDAAGADRHAGRLRLLLHEDSCVRETAEILA